MIRLATNYSSFFIRCHSETAAFAPDLKLGFGAFRFCHFRCFCRFHWVYPVAFESARASRLCNLPGACNCLTGRSAPVFLPTAVRVFLILRCGRGRTEWVYGTSGSERRDTIACRPWAIERYSTDLTPMIKDSSWKYSTATRKTVQE